MNIILKQKLLYLNEYKIKCAIGKTGITSRKIEGDEKTPRGSFALKSIFYRKDRISNIKSSLKKTIIKKNMGWCDDPKSKKYNKLIRFPFFFKAERLHKRKNIYDIIIILNYNLKPIIKNKGSAIFIHIATQKYQKTKGCIAISKNNIIKLIDFIDKKSLIKIF